MVFSFIHSFCAATLMVCMLLQAQKYKFYRRIFLKPLETSPYAPVLDQDARLTSCAYIAQTCLYTCGYYFHQKTLSDYDP